MCLFHQGSWSSTDLLCFPEMRIEKRFPVIAESKKLTSCVRMLNVGIL